MNYNIYIRKDQLPQGFLGTPIWPPFHCFWYTNMAASTSYENALLRGNMSLIKLSHLAWFKCDKQSPHVTGMVRFVDAQSYVEQSDCAGNT